MKYLKYFKLFEAYNEDTKFYRFSRFVLDEGEMDPEKRAMWGSPEFNQSLVKSGFPDKSKCIHFMDSLAFNPEYKGLYGRNIYEIKVDDSSNLGWSFVIPINDWVYRGNTFQHELRNGNQLIFDIMQTEFADPDYFDSVDDLTNFLVQYGAIGNGTLHDFKNSKFFGKEKAFVWTTDKVFVSEYKAPEKVGKPGTYKSDRLLNADDFASRGITADKISQFYQSELGKNIKKLQPTESFEWRRKQALILLDQWSQTNKFE